jgi:hypothetical protein
MLRMDNGEAGRVAAQAVPLACHHTPRFRCPKVEVEGTTGRSEDKGKDK